MSIGIMNGHFFITQRLKTPTPRFRDNIKDVKWVTEIVHASDQKKVLFYLCEGEIGRLYYAYRFRKLNKIEKAIYL